MLNNKDNTTAHNALDYDEQVQKTIPFYTEFHNQTIQLVKATKPTPKAWLDTGCGNTVTYIDKSNLSERLILSDRP